MEYFLLHGFWGQGKDWYWSEFIKNSQFLEGKKITFGKWLHSEDSNFVGKISLEEYYQDIKEQILKLEEKPIVIAHSTGCGFAMKLAAEGLTREIILLAPSAPRGRMLYFSVLRTFWTVMLPGFWNREICLSRKKAVYAMLHRLSPESQDFIYQNLAPASGRALAQIGFPDFDGGFFRNLKISEKIYIVSAGDDRVAKSDKIAKKICKLFPETFHFCLKDACHFLLAGSDCKIVAILVEKFLRELDN